jgi:hypothetical protein
MTPNCRHIKTDGVQCGSPATNNQLFCHNHRKVRRALAQVSPAPDPYGWERKPLPLVFSEDRAALQLNYSLVIAAVVAGRMTVQTANCLNRLLRSCEMNLTHGPLATPDADIVQNIVLTPEGEEIAPAEDTDPQVAESSAGEDAETALNTDSGDQARSFTPPPITMALDGFNDPSSLKNRRGLESAIRREHLAAYAAGLEPPAYFPPTPAAAIACPEPVDESRPEPAEKFCPEPAEGFCAEPAEPAAENKPCAPSADPGAADPGAADPGAADPGASEYPLSAQSQPCVPRNALEAAYYSLPWPFPESAHPLTSSPGGPLKLA